MVHTVMKQWTGSIRLWQKGRKKHRINTHPVIIHVKQLRIPWHIWSGTAKKVPPEFDVQTATCRPNFTGSQATDSTRKQSELQDVYKDVNHVIETCCCCCQRLTVGVSALWGSLGTCCSLYAIHRGRPDTQSATCNIDWKLDGTLDLNITISTTVNTIAKH